MKRFIVLSLLLLLLPIVMADMGPKPTLNFDISYETGGVPDNIQGTILTCVSLDYVENQTEFLERLARDDSMQAESDEDFREYIANDPTRNYNFVDEEENCLWARSTLAWGKGCSSHSCSYGYHPPNPFILVLYDGAEMYVSESRSWPNFHQSYDVRLREDGSMIFTDISGFNWHLWKPFLIALLLTLIIEGLVSLIFIKIWKLELKKTLLIVMAGSIVTLPILWFGLGLKLGAFGAILIGEPFVFILEAFILRLAIPSWWKSFLLSFLMNLLSFLLGGFFMILFMPF